MKEEKVSQDVFILKWKNLPCMNCANKCSKEICWEVISFVIDALWHHIKKFNSHFLYNLFKSFYRCLDVLYLNFLGDFMQKSP